MRISGPLCLAAVLGCCLTALAQVQSAPSSHLAVKRPPGIPHDWSHRHLIFSKPPKAPGRPPLRYTMQQAWRKRQLIAAQAPALDALAAKLVSLPKPTELQDLSLLQKGLYLPGRRVAKAGLPQIHRDWAQSLGTSATVGELGFPAKFSFAITSANCANTSSPDFVVFNTGPAGAATGLITFTGPPNAGDKVTVGATTYEFETQCTTSPPANCVVASGDSQGSAGNLQAAIMDQANLCNGANNPCFGNLSSANASASALSSRPTNGTGTVTLTALIVGSSGNSVALSTTAASTRITVSGTTLTGGADMLATIVAYDNLYSGCTGTAPEVYWQYNTGYGSGLTWDHSVIPGSVVLSGDGSQVAFVQDAGGAASLVILKWASNPALVQMDSSTTNVAPSAYRACTAPCMTRIPFGNSANDTGSSPFYDYFTDALYVGDDSGALHKFTGVFVSGSPAEATSPWPITVSSAMLTSPVYDSNQDNPEGSGNVYIGDGTGYLWYVRESGSTVGTCETGLPPCLGQVSYDVGDGSSRPIVDAPIVDSGSQEVFAVIGCAGTAADCGSASANPAVAQLPTDLNATDAVVFDLGVSSRESNIHDGDFDNNYYSGNYADGYLYECGNLNGSSARTLYRIHFNSLGQMTAINTGPALSADSTADCLPITEIFNGSTDRIFESIRTAGIATDCPSGGCLMSFMITSWSPTTSYSAGQEILDSNGALESVTQAGTSASTQPTWPAPGSSVTDNTVKWTNQGEYWGSSAWQGGTSYSTAQVILDSNFNLEKATTAGTSGGSQPSWPTATGNTVTDGTVVWTNEGPGNANLAVSGGASGIIVDNTVPVGILSGASQIYFSPLLNGTCGMSSSVGCAIQASQQGLQ
jgi:hypothetical protein